MVTTKNSPGFPDQRPGTSGLRKKTRIFMVDPYLSNFIQSIFTSLDIKGKGGLISTPSASLLLRTYSSLNLEAGILLTASHNPGGLHEDFGVKLNDSTGAPAAESLTNAIAEIAASPKDISILPLNPIQIDRLGLQSFASGSFTVNVIDPVESWLECMRGIFDFPSIGSLLKRKNFSMIFDGLNGVIGNYARRLFQEEFGISSSSLLGCIPMEDFGGSHPDPNLVYAKTLVERMNIFSSSSSLDIPEFGAAVDGDGDRNMILGRGFFVTPSDSVAIIAENAQKCIPYFKNGLRGVARSMPTSKALEIVANKLGIPAYETPVGWKYFVNLMDSGKVNLCGEESFGTGSDHIREKDGLWAILAWLNILAYYNKDSSRPIVSVEEIVRKYWRENGRNYYLRFDYEAVDTQVTLQMIEHLRSFTTNSKNEITSNYPKLKERIKNQTFIADEFSYKDPIDGSTAEKQGIRFLFGDGGRIIWRISGTGSEGLTIRVYFEVYEEDPNRLNSTNEEAVHPLVEIAAECSKIVAFTGREAPTIIT
ncbi:glucosephosphate-mutase GPM1 [Cardiosporidium cionae]|uniref:phosphoglucomutase (alpha-D-glucose-1,6-bisphosphate-dependent) n=1 Tax=Cardiosporidium cionae TaxID=476202 RepID=A0ABQ7JEH9_9APIC|nr:glucosephosphate-mutase GPM1 [Cardiosporidium cionae]|eukprot:KAF8822403.1 glucosephosphate-mutase GPM1 [Cardiosporidium cionae]